jgi:hypothetical protein
MIPAAGRRIGCGTIIRHEIAKCVFLPLEFALFGLFLWKLRFSWHGEMSALRDDKRARRPPCAAVILLGGRNRPSALSLIE